MLSRVAESIYWMARYVERAENTARLINVNSNLLLDLPKGISPGWKPLVIITGYEEIFEEHYGEYSERNVAKFLISDLRNPSSILSSLSLARENARTIRDFILRECWESINDLYLHAKSNTQAGVARNGRFEFLKEVVVCVQQMTGMLAGAMSHNAGYDFLRAGRNLERADMTSRIVDTRSASLIPGLPDLTPFENIQWMSVLRSLTAYQMYRLHTRTRVSRALVLQFLLQDVSFPRSFRHCLEAVESSIKNLPGNDNILKRIASARLLVMQADLSNVSQDDLFHFIDELQLALAEIHNIMHQTYWSVAVDESEEDSTQSQSQSQTQSQSQSKKKKKKKKKTTSKQ